MALAVRIRFRRSSTTLRVGDDDPTLIDPIRSATRTHCLRCQRLTMNRMADRLYTGPSWRCGCVTKETVARRPRFVKAGDLASNMPSATTLMVSRCPRIAARAVHASHELASRGRNLKGKKNVYTYVDARLVCRNRGRRSNALGRNDGPGRHGAISRRFICAF
jgi:hypothetical protein